MTVRSRRKAGISDMVAHVLVIAITIITGAGVFSFVNSQAGVSAQQYGENVGSHISYFGEQFIIADINFTSSNVTVWIYNNGQSDLKLVQALVYNGSKSVYIRHNATHVTNLNSPSTCTRTASIGLQNPNISTVTLKNGQMIKLTLSLPQGGTCPAGLTFNNGITYSVNILAKEGNMLIYSRQK